MVVTRVEVTPKQGEGMRDVRGDSVRRQLLSDHGISASDVRSIVGFLIKSEISSEEISSRTDDLFTDPIIEIGSTNELAISNSEIFPNTPDCVITIGFKPGVTDNPGKAALDGFHTIFSEAKDAEISTYITYAFYGLPADCDSQWLAGTIHNGLIQRAIISDSKACANGQWAEIEFPERLPQVFTAPERINLEISNDELEKLSYEGLLALNLEEMQTIQGHYRDCLLYTSPSPRDKRQSRMPSSA